MVILELPADVVISIAPAEFNVKPPVPASNSISTAFISTLEDESLPTVIVLAEAPVPILIVPVFASLPTFIEPPEELKDIFPVESKSTVVAPDNVVAPLPAKANVAVPSVNVNAFTEVNVNANASIVTAVLSADPRANVPFPCGSMVILELFADVVISIAPAEFNVKPPLLGSTTIVSTLAVELEIICVVEEPVFVATLALLIFGPTNLKVVFPLLLLPVLYV